MAVPLTIRGRARIGATQSPEVVLHLLLGGVQEFQGTISGHTGFNGPLVSTQVLPGVLAGQTVLGGVLAAGTLVAGGQVIGTTALGAALALTLRLDGGTVHGASVVVGRPGPAWFIDGTLAGATGLAGAVIERGTVEVAGGLVAGVSVLAGLAWFEGYFQPGTVLGQAMLAGRVAVLLPPPPTSINYQARTEDTAPLLLTEPYAPELRSELTVLVGHAKVR